MRRWIPLRLLFIVLAGTTVLYLPTLKYEAIWDTRDFLRQSILLNQDRPLTDAFAGGYIYGQMGVSGQSIYYRPLVNFTFMLEKRLWGLSPRTLRRTNLFIFLTLLILVFAVLRTWNMKWSSVLGATALFAVSPIIPGNVVWIVGRGDLMMLMWGLLTILLLRRKKRLGPWAVPAAWLAFILAILSKETALFLIPLFFLSDPPGLGWKQRYHHLGFIFTGGVFLAIKHLVLKIGSPALLLSTAILDYPMRGLAVTGHYAQTLLLPFRAPLFNFVSEVETPFHILFGTLAILSLLAFAVWAFRSPGREALRFPLALTGIFLLPFVLLSFTSMWPFRLSTRYMMTASLGFFWLLTLALEKIPRRVRPLAIIALILLFLPATLFHSQTHGDELTYWSRALNAHPGNPTLILKLAETHYMQKNDLEAYALLKHGTGWHGRRLTATHWRFLQAKLEAGRFKYSAALTLMDAAAPLPPSLRFQSELLRARIDASMGNFRNAETRLRDLIRKTPQRPEPHARLHLLLTGLKEWESAEQLEIQARRCLGSRVTWRTSEMRMRFSRFSPPERMRFFIQHLNFPEALETLRKISPLESLEDQLFLAWIHFQAGREADANERVQQAAILFPSPHARARIGQFYLEHLNRPEDALPWYRRALDQNEKPEWQESLQRLKQLVGETEQVTISVTEIP